MQVAKKHDILEAVRWYTLQDSPLDINNKPIIVSYYEHKPSDIGQCDQCMNLLVDHGWLNNGWRGVMVCPGNYIVKRTKGEYQVLSEEAFDKQYEIINPHRPLFCRSFQDRAYTFFLECFSEQFPELMNDKTENKHRFVEEALEFVQSLNMSKEEVLALVDYVYSRPLGDPLIEAGGVATTYSILCKVHGIDVIQASERELKRNYRIIDKIREKQYLKNKLNIKIKQ